MGLLILLKFLILFRLKWILFELIYGVVWAIFVILLWIWANLFCYLSLKMGLLILLKFLILFRLKWILFELIYGVVWAIFGFRVQESGADLCHCLSIFFGLKGHDFGGG